MQMFHLPSAKVFVILLWPNMPPRNRPTTEQGELTLKLPLKPAFVIRDQIMKARYAYKRWNPSFTRKQGWGILRTSKIIPSLLIMLKPEAHRGEEMRQADSPRKSCWMQSSILSWVPHHAALESLLQWLHRHHALIIMFSPSDSEQLSTPARCTNFPS